MLVSIMSLGLNAQTLYGDVNGDNAVNISDVNSIINDILDGGFSANSDVNDDGVVNITDINAIINVILGGGDFSWEDASVNEIERYLRATCGDETVDITAVVDTLKTNKNVEEAFVTPDQNKIIIQFKGDEYRTVYPIHDEVDPFAEEDTVAEPSASTMFNARQAPRHYRPTGSRGKVAVFNYFSKMKSDAGDMLTGRTTQNRMIDYLCQDLNDHDYGVEYYPYEEVTLDNLKKVRDNASSYTAVIIMSHGFSDGNNSYFIISEEYDSKRAHEDPMLYDEGVSIPYSYRFWNTSVFDFGSRYEFAVPVKKMYFSSNTILYLGSCDAYRHTSDFTQSDCCIGWNGPNSSAQAHATVLFYKLMRGKSVRDALDVSDSENPYYDNTGAETDTWTADPMHEDSKLTYFGVHFDPNIFSQPNYLTPVTQYYRDAGSRLHPVNYGDFDFRKGVHFISDKKIKLDLIMDGNEDAPQAIFVRATPLRSDASPVVYKVNKKSQNGSNGYYKQVTIDLKQNGAYSITAAVDEAFTQEIKFLKPIIIVKAKPFKENGLEEDTTQTETFTVNGVSFTMVGVEGGTFTMGATDEQGIPEEVYGFAAYSMCFPTHQVTLSSYSIGETEVTQELWAAVMGNNPSYFADDLTRPVEQVSWIDCQTFIAKLNQLTGKTFRLLTEAEWEFAARGGNKSMGYQYSGSNNIDEVAWYEGNSENSTHPVGLKSPNELGLYDMTGNVMEWCQDWYGMDYYSVSPLTNPTGPSTGDKRIVRGGSFYDIINKGFEFAVALRNYMSPTYSFRHTGLRLAMDGEPE